MKLHCVNGHPYPASLKSNGRGCAVCASEQSRARHQANGLKIHCKHGHEFTPENTKVNSRGQRICQACVRERPPKTQCANGHPYPESLRPDGSRCAVCEREKAAARYRENPEVRAAAAARYREDPEKAKATTAAWRLANRDKVLERSKEYSAAWRLANPEKARATTKAWRAANNDHYNSWRRAWRAAGGERLPHLLPEDKQLTKEWVQIISKDPCSYCGKPFEHVDHITPISRGGGGTWDNLTAACAICNLRKNAKPLLMFLYDQTLAETDMNALIS